MYVHLPQIINRETLTAQTKISKILVGLGAVILIFLIFVETRSADFRVERSSTIAAPAQALFDQVNDHYNFNKWNPFLTLDPNVKNTYRGPNLILDDYGTHGHERVRRWLAKHHRFVLHFLPTSASWLNLVERWFAKLSQKTERRGVFRSVQELEQAIQNVLSAWNAQPTSFVWTASVEKILEKWPVAVVAWNKFIPAARSRNVQPFE